MKLNIHSIFVLMFLMVFLLAFQSGNLAKNNGIEFNDYTQNILKKIDINKTKFYFEEINNTENLEQLYSKEMNNFISKIAYTFVDLTFDFMRIASIKGYDYEGEVDVVNVIRLISIIIIIEILFLPVMIFILLTIYILKRAKERREDKK